MRLPVAFQNGSRSRCLKIFPPSSRGRESWLIGARLGARLWLQERCLLQQRRSLRNVRLWRILLQNSFGIDQHKFSGPYVRRTNNDWRAYVTLRCTHSRLR